MTDAGQLHRVLGNVIPSDKATALQNVVLLAPSERVLLLLCPPDPMDDLFLATSFGTIKRIGGSDLAGGDRKGGISIIKLEDDERVVAAFPSPHPGVPVALVTAQGQIIRFIPDDVRTMGRTAAGVRGIRLASGDRVVAATTAPEGVELTVFHDRGSAKRVPADSIFVQGRAGKGVRLTVVGGRHGEVVAVSNSMVTEIIGSSADGELLNVTRSSIALLSREAAPAKIRAFDGVLATLLNDPTTWPPAPIARPGSAVPAGAQPRLPLDPD